MIVTALPLLLSISLLWTSTLRVTHCSGIGLAPASRLLLPLQLDDVRSAIVRWGRPSRRRIIGSGIMMMAVVPVPVLPVGA